MGSVRLKIAKLPPTWLLLGSAVWVAACGVDVIDTVQSQTAKFSAADCAAAVEDVFAMANPTFSVTSPPNYDSCGEAYVVDIRMGDHGGVIGGEGVGATYHHDLIVSYAGPTATTRSACEKLYAAAYFYDHPPGSPYRSVSLMASPGQWLPQRDTCIPPQLDLRDFDPYFSQGDSSDVRIAATMRGPSEMPVPLVVSAVQYGMAAPTGCAASDQTTAHMMPNQGLFADQWLSSCDGRFRLAMQSYGDLVLSEADSAGDFPVALWGSHTGNIPAANLLTMQDDGNLVISALDGTVIWSSNTSGRPGLHLELSNDGNLRLYDRAYGTVWQTNTGGH